jgi:hypothetical protein
MRRTRQPSPLCRLLMLLRRVQDLVGLDLSCGEMGDQLAVGRQEVVVGEFFWQSPDDVFVHDGSDISLKKLRGEKVNLQLLRKVRVLMENFRNFAAFGEGDTEFFAQLARKSVLQSFSVMYLAAGKFPLQRGRVVMAALSDQDAAIGSFDDGGYDNHSVFTRAKA